MATHYQGTEHEIRALNAYIKMMRAANSVSERVHAHLLSHKLTSSQFGVLEVLYHLGPLFQKDIAEKLLKSGGNITLVIDNLEKRDLVKRRRSEKDRRFIKVYLTGKGTRLLKDILPAHVTAIVQEMDSLDKSEQEELGRLCRKLGLKANPHRKSR